MKQIYFGLLSAVTLFSGCGKDGEDMPLVLEGEYRAGTTLLAANPIIMYTSSGQTDNAAVIDRYLKRNPQFDPSSFSRANITLPADGVFTLLVRATNRATMVSSYAARHDTTEAEIITKEPSYFVLADMDSTGFGPAFQTNPYPNECQNFTRKVKLVYPGERCRPVSFSSGTYEKVCKIRPVRVIRIKDRKLFIPQFSWLFKHTSIASYGNSVCGQGSSNEWNLLDPTAPSKLGSGDTLVVQERLVELLKQ